MVSMLIGVLILSPIVAAIFSCRLISDLGEFARQQREAKALAEQAISEGKTAIIPVYRPSPFLVFRHGRLRYVAWVDRYRYFYNGKEVNLHGEPHA